MALTEKSAHLSWCALIALALEKQEKGRLSSTQENIFLLRWFSTALKQHRFPRDFSSEIEWLICIGKKSTGQISLSKKIESLWRFCTSEISHQADLFRLTYVLDTAVGLHWQYHILSDSQWAKKNAILLSPAINAIYIPHRSLDVVFDSEGRQILPLMARLTGNVEGLHTLLNKCGWKAEIVANDQYLYKLVVAQGGLTPPR